MSNNEDFQTKIENKLTEIYHDFLMKDMLEEAEAVEVGLFSKKAWDAVLKYLDSMTDEELGKTIREAVKKSTERVG